MSSDHRRYRLKVRAQRQNQTRQRIVEATQELHREVGPARTTIADVARRAGVQRLTVYNHFPETRQLLAACQGHFLASHPPPDVAPQREATAEQALDGLEAALLRLYRWFRANEALQAHVNRDRNLLPELDELMRENADPRFDEAAAGHARLITKSRYGRTRARRLVRLAFEFKSWQLLAADGAPDPQIASLFRLAVGCLV